MQSVSSSTHAVSMASRPVTTERFPGKPQPPHWTATANGIEGYPQLNLRTDDLLKAPVAHQNSPGSPSPAAVEAAAGGDFHAPRQFIDRLETPTAARFGAQRAAGTTRSRTLGPFCKSGLCFACRDYGQSCLRRSYLHSGWRTIRRALHTGASTIRASHGICRNVRGETIEIPRQGFRSSRS